MHLEVVNGHRRWCVLELLHQLLHVADASALCHQDCVLACDHHQIIDAEQRNQRLVRGDIGVVDVDEDCMAARRIAGSFCVRSHTAAMIRRPTSRRTPGSRRRAWSFHDRIVDRDRPRLLE